MRGKIREWEHYCSTQSYKSASDLRDACYLRFILLARFWTVCDCHKNSASLSAQILVILLTHNFVYNKKEPH